MVHKMRILVAVLALLGLPALAETHTGKPNSPAIAFGGGGSSTAQAVLDQLYQTAGIFSVKKPVLKITPENLKVAAFAPGKNTIFLDEKTLAICRNMGRDSLAALAFVLGHELAHAFQSARTDGRQRTNFLAYDHAYPEATRFEKIADIQGVMNACLAGYDARTAMPRLLESVYEAYNLTGKNLPAYPSLAERQAAASEVGEIAQRLLDLFDSANYLLAIGKPELAAAALEHILQFYRGREVLNNLGLCRVRAAQAFWNPRTDAFLLPFEADWKSQLDRAADAARGAADQSNDPLRQQLLDRAADNFQEALALDPSYFPAKLNLVCISILSEKPEEALARWGEFFGKKSKPKRQADDRALLAKALALNFKTEGKTESRALLQQLATTRNRLTALFARQNLLVLDTGAADLDLGADFELPAAFVDMAKSVPLGRTAELPATQFDAANGLFFQKKQEGNTATLVFSNAAGSLVSLVRFQNRLANATSVLPPRRAFDDDTYRNILPTRDGFFLRVPGEQVLLKCDPRGNVLEMIRYFLH